jgi:periplasmic protein TonB
MLISKFDLYKHEWLELVFENRNKDYGAYELRQHYAGNMVRAMGITFLGIGLLMGVSVIITPRAAPIVQRTIDHITEVHIAKIDIIKPPAPKKLEAANPPAALKTRQFVPFVVKPDELAVNPPKITELTVPISSITTAGKQGGNNILPEINIDNGTGTKPTVEPVYTPGGVDIMPEPFGGESAWSKFLSKNLRYPAPAQEEGVSGRVILSFIVEKNGHLTEISIIKGAGHGFDEEALRVLKLAKDWKPGMQNGQPVRVRYMIPINFQLSE